MLLHPARGTSFSFLEWGGEKEVLPESCQTLPEHWTGLSCFPVLNWFYECEHRFVNKAMVIAEPTVPSVRLLGLGSRLYPSNMPRMPNKDRIRFKQRLSRRATIEQVNARRCSQSDVVHAIFFFFRTKWPTHWHPWDLNPIKWPDLKMSVNPVMHC